MVKWPKFRRGKSEKTELVKTESAKTTEPVYYTTRGGITLVGENVCDRIVKEGREKEKDKKDKTTTLQLLGEAKKELGLPSDIDLIDTEPKNLFFYVQALLPEDAKKKIGEYQSKLETGYGIKINLKKLRIRERS